MHITFWWIRFVLYTQLFICIFKNYIWMHEEITKQNINIWYFFCHSVRQPANRHQATMVGGGESVLYPIIFMASPACKSWFDKLLTACLLAWSSDRVEWNFLVSRNEMSLTAMLAWRSWLCSLKVVKLLAHPNLSWVLLAFSTVPWPKS